MKKCPFCAEEIQEDAILCRYCKSDLTAPEKITFIDRVRKYLIPIILIFGLLTAILIGILYYSNEIEHREEILGNLQATSSQQKYLAEKLTGNLQTTEKKLSTAQKIGEDLQTNLGRAESEIDSLQATSTAIDIQLLISKKMYKSSQSTVTDLRKKYEKLSPLLCPEKILGDYTSNEKMRVKLSNFVQENVGKQLGSSYRLVWNNSNTAYHEIRFQTDEGTFMDIYLVFFDEPELRSKHGIFWISHQCWLDR